MACMKCGGFLVVEPSCDFWEERSVPDIPGTRCLNCGNIEDRLIRMNRTARAPVPATDHTTLIARRGRSIPPAGY